MILKIRHRNSVTAVLSFCSCRTLYTAKPLFYGGAARGRTDENSTTRTEGQGPYLRLDLVGLDCAGVWLDISAATIRHNSCSSDRHRG
jgi:hypothetical protein